MGRIAYFDARARKQVADAAPFDAQLNRMQKDLLFYTVRALPGRLSALSIP